MELAKTNKSGVELTGGVILRKNKKGIGEILDFGGNFQLFTILGCILSGISAVLSLMPFMYIWFVVRDVFEAYPNVSEAKNLVYYGWMAVIFAITSILVYFVALMCTHISAFRVARNIRSRALHHIIRLPLGYLSSQGSGKLRRVIDESSGQTETFLAHQIPDLTGAYVTPVAMIVLLFAFDWRLGLISLVPIFIGFAFMSKMAGPTTREKVYEYQNALENMNNEAVEYVRGIPVVKTFQQSIFSFKNFHDAILRYKKWVVEYTISLRIPMTCFTVCINAIFAFLVPAGILLIATAVNYQEFLKDFIFYVLFTPYCTLMMTRILYSSESSMIAKDAINRINSILDEKPLKEPENPLLPKGGEITFKNVGFTYRGANRQAINNMSFHVPQGATYALVGPSGGGKTTVASLIPRFWDVDSGNVMVGGIDVREIATDVLMENISFVFQDTHLFKTTLLENIRSAKPNASQDEIMEAIRAATM